MRLISNESIRTTDRPEERVYRSINLALSRKIQSVSRESWLPVVRSNIRMRRDASNGVLMQERMDEWERLVDGPLETVVMTLLRDDEIGYNMRQCAPFAGVLTNEERIEAIKVWR